MALPVDGLWEYNPTMSWTRYFHRRSWDRERAREIEAYLEIETADNRARGMTPLEARYAAQRKLGNTTLIREEIYRMNTFAPLETLWQDFRYALRVLRKSPVFTMVAILSLALGVGANTAVFTVVHAVLLRPLPYPEPDRVVSVGNSVTIPEFEFWRANTASFMSAAGYRGASNRRLVDGARQESIGAMTITAGFFQTLGTSLALGREFDGNETRSDGPRAIVLSDGLWRQAFGADPKVVGKVVTVDDRNFTVVGVAPPGFWFTQAADAYLPLRPSGSMSDNGFNTGMIARLKPGVTVRQANAEMPAVMTNFRRAHPDPNAPKDRAILVTPLQESLTENVRTTLWLLLGAVALLLLIACSNLGSLLLARLSARQKEMAVRLALGSGAWRLLRQFLVESMLLAVAGSAAGFLAAYWSFDALLALVPLDLPSSAPIRPDLPVLAFAAAIALGAGALFSLPGLIGSARMDLHATLQVAGRSGSAGARQRARNVLVAGEVALSVMLLVSAALLMQSLYRLNRERLGFSPQGLLTFWMPPLQGGYRTGPDPSMFHNAVVERLQTLPGVRGVAAVNVLPLTGQSNFPAEHDGHPEHAIGGMEIRYVTPRYFETMGTTIVRGRGFTSRDTASAPPVLLVNETVARQWWPQENPLGGRVVLCRMNGKTYCDVKDPSREVVGVVADSKTVSLRRPARPTVYLATAQAGWYDGGMDWVVRGTITAQQLRQAIAEIEPRQKIEKLRPVEAILAKTTADSRFDAWLFGLFAALALVLTAIGVYGVLAFAVARRTNEIGTRMALGASRSEVLLMVLRQGLRLVTTGLVLGLAGAFVVTRSLTTLLFGVHPGDPLSFAAVAIVLLAVGFLASYLPATRATKVDPMVALRYE
jgi:putative ABC transport system permease protein